MRKALRIAGFSMFLLAAGLGCQSAAGTKQSAGGSGAKAGHLGGSGSSNAGGNQGGNNGTGGSSALPSVSLALKTATAHFDGRLGNRVRLTISGEQTLGMFASVAVTALDSSGNSINWFDPNHDSTLDSSTGYLVPQAIPHEATFSFDLLVPISQALVDWSQAQISLFDRADAISNQLSVAVEQQPVRTSGQACDPASKTDRCAEGLECSATSSTCVSHVGPSLTQVAYVTTSNGPLLIAAGSDNAEDLIEMHIGFFDSSGSSVLVNLNNDSTSPQMASSFTETAGITPNDGTFAFQISPSETFTQTVKSVSFVPVDAVNKKGTSLTASLLPQPSRGSGSPCDVQGFNFCSGNSACVPGLSGASNTCQPLGSAQPAACKVAPVLDPSTKSLVVTGYSIGSSLWEPPTSCVSDMGLHHPETVIKLHLPAKLPSLTLSTDRRETQTDTVLYVASACSPSTTQILGCNDDIAPGNVASTVTLTNVAAGDYYVIVDTIRNDGGPFALTFSTP
jgi:hypothetical protein